MNPNDLIKSIYAKVSPEEKEFLSGLFDEYSFGVLVTLENKLENKIETEQSKNIRAIGAKTKKKSKFNHLKFQKDFAKFTQENSLNFFIKDEWRSYIGKNFEPDSRLSKYCIKNGPMHKIPHSLGLAISAISKDGSVLANMDELLILEENAKAEELRKKFIEIFERKVKERADKISDFRMNWRG
jgi:hypothetical protein